MDFSGQGFTFGDFEDLNPEEFAAVEKILHDNQGPCTKRVEFPWDTKQDDSVSDCGITFGQDFTSALPPSSHPLSGIPVFQGGPLPPFAIPIAGTPGILPMPPAVVPTVLTPPQVAAPIIPAIHPVIMTNAQFSQGYLPDVIMETKTEDSAFVQQQQQQQEVNELPVESDDGKKDNGALNQLSSKPYTRRNKKKRPPDYYEKYNSNNKTRDPSAVIDSTEGYNSSDDSLNKEKKRNFIETRPLVLNAWDATTSDQDERETTPSSQEESDFVSNCTLVKTDNPVICCDSTTLNKSSDINSNIEKYDTAITENVERGLDLCNDLSTVSTDIITEYDSHPSKSPDSCVPSTDSQSSVTDSFQPDVVSKTDSDSCASTRTSESVSTGSQEAQKPKASTWASLFKSTNSVTNELPVPVEKTTGKVQIVENSSEECVKEKTVNEVMTAVTPAEDRAAKQLGEILDMVPLLHMPISLQPRGLVNRGNWCYISATLQALVACPPFYHLMKKLPAFPALKRGPSSTPMLDSMIEFINEFSTINIRALEKADKLGGLKGKKSVELPPGAPFEPVNIYKMLQMMEANPSFKLGKQEDAEEFLSCLLDGLHEEMSSAMKLASDNTNHVTDKRERFIGNEIATNGFAENPLENNIDDEEDDESWEQVGPKNRSVFTRKADFAKTPVSKIFAGYIRSAVYQSSSKESATLQPFFTLQLDIQSDKVWSLKDAMDGLVSKESVPDYTCSKTNTEVEIVRKITLEELPPVLVLHLKCFVYDKSGGSQKLLKNVDYSVDLEITKDLLSPSVRNKINYSQRSYKLFAVVFHHGKQATGGHYTTATYHSGINGWIHIDDSVVKRVSVQDVLKYSSPRVPYLLYYRRIDVNQ